MFFVAKLVKRLLNYILCLVSDFSVLHMKHLLIILVSLKDNSFFFFIGSVFLLIHLCFEFDTLQHLNYKLFLMFNGKKKGSFLGSLIAQSRK